MTVEITYLHDWTVQLNGGTYGLAQMNNADPHCFVYFGTWITTLDFSPMTCVFCFARLLAGLVCAAEWLVCRPTRPNHALQRTRPSRHRCNRGVPRAGSLSLGR